MTNTKTTKRALLASVLSIVICLTMLIGSTFAWFTDSATTGVNTIQSGNLKIGMYYADGTTDPNSADWKNAEGASIFNYDLWEPGYTVANHIKISNEGNLALKYLLNFNIEGEIGKLAEVIDVYFVDPAVQVADRSSLASATPIGTLKQVLDGTIPAPTGDLEATKSNIVTIALKMKESANNDYQNQSVGKLTIHLFATQDTVEKDSFDNQYDAGAGFHYDVKMNAETAGKHLVGANGKILSAYIINNNTVDNFIVYAGATSSASASQVSGTNTFNNCVFVANDKNSFWADTVEKGAVITFNNCTFEAGVKLGGNTDVKYIFNNCSFAGKTDWTKGLILAYAPVELNNCTFDYSGGALYSVYQSVGSNHSDVKVIEGEAIVANKATNTSPVVAKLITKNSATDIPVVTSEDELDNAVAAATSEETKILLVDGTYTNLTFLSANKIQNKTITLMGSKKAVIDASSQVNVNGVQDWVGTTLTFDGVTVKWSDANEGYQGIKNPRKVIYKNCTIIGTQFMYAGADFIGCEFKTVNSYAVYTRAAGNYTFTDCNFITGGRAIMMYNDAAINATVKLTNCTFSDDGTYTSKDKAAVETGNGGGASKYQIEINNCKITNGFEKNNSTSALWGNKDNMTNENLNVVIDGVDVY